MADEDVVLFGVEMANNYFRPFIEINGDTHIQGYYDHHNHAIIYYDPFNEKRNFLAV